MAKPNAKRIKTSNIKTRDTDAGSSLPRTSQEQENMLRQIDKDKRYIVMGQSFLKSLAQDLSKQLRLNTTLYADIQQMLALSTDIECKIPMIGETGSGKSTAISALLDAKDFVPSSNLGDACTTAPIEIHENKFESHELVAEIQYETEVNWRAVIESAKAALNDTETPQEAAKGPFDQIRAFYSQLSEEQLKSMSTEEILRSNDQRKLLGQTNYLKHNDRKDFCRDVAKHVATSVSKDSALWPIIVVVRLYVEHPLIQHGLVLVDPPGVGDQNAARTEEANHYLRTSSALVVMTPTGRANANVHFQGLIKRALRQVHYDDRLDRVILVCSRSDEVDLDQVQEQLKPSGLDELRAELQQHKQQLNSLQQQISDEKQNLEQRTESMHQCDKDIPRWKRQMTNARNGKKVNIPKSPINGFHVNLDGPLDEPRIEGIISSLRTKSQDFSKKVKKLQTSVAEHEAEIWVAEKYVAESSLMYKRRVFGARTDYVKSKQTRMFVTQVKSYEKQAREAAQQIGKEFVSNQSDSNQYQNMEARIPVFCVSAKSFQDLKGIARMPAATRVIETLEDTEIPALAQHLRAIAISTTNRHLKSLRTKLVLVLNTVSEATSDHSESERSSRQIVIVDSFSDRLADLPNQFRAFVEVAERSINSGFKREFVNKLPDIVCTTLNRAIQRMARFAEPPDPYNDGAKGLYAQEYKAACAPSRCGLWTGSRRHVDFNDTVAAPVKLNVQNIMKGLFTTETDNSNAEKARNALTKCLAEIEEHVTAVHQIFRSAAAVVQTDQNILNTLDDQLQLRIHDIANTVVDAKPKIADVHSSTSALITSDIRNLYAAAYERAHAIKGQGMRDAVIRELHRSLEKDRVIGLTIDKLSDRMRRGVEGVIVDLQNSLKQTAESMVLDYTQALHPRTHRLAITDQELREKIRNNIDSLRAHPGIRVNEGSGNDVCIKAEAKYDGDSDEEW